MRASGSQPPRCSSSKRTPVMRISSGGLPAAATSPIGDRRRHPVDDEHVAELRRPNSMCGALSLPLRVDVVDVGVRRLGDVRVGGDHGVGPWRGLPSGGTRSQCNRRALAPWAARSRPTQPARRAMKFGVMFANVGPFGQPEGLTHLAQTAERVGIESLWTVEHVVMPVGLPVDVSVRPDGQDARARGVADPRPAGRARVRRGGDEDDPARDRHPDPAAAPSALRRQGGRDARRALGRPRDPRHRRRLARGGVRGARHPVRGARGAHRGVGAAIRTLWKDEPTPFDGKFYRWAPLESHPKPVQKPGVPIVVGGHTLGAAKRAARYGDGFFPGAPDDAPSSCSASCATSARRSAATRRDRDHVRPRRRRSTR